MKGKGERERKEGKNFVVAVAYRFCNEVLKRREGYLGDEIIGHEDSGGGRNAESLDSDGKSIASNMESGWDRA